MDVFYLDDLFWQDARSERIIIIVVAQFHIFLEIHVLLSWVLVFELGGSPW